VIIEDSQFRILHDGTRWPPTPELSSRRSPATARTATPSPRSKLQD
jgi:hypothetical protein